MGKFRGNTIFEGIVIAKPYIKKRKEIFINELSIEEEAIESELERVQEALKQTRTDIKELIESLKDRVNKNELKILNVQLVMLDDPLFLSDINNLIKKEKKNAEFVIDRVVKKYVGMFKSLNDPVYKERATDVEEVGNKLLQNLLLEKPELEDINNKIMITKELKPFELLRYYNLGVVIKGIVTEEGGETSHAAILAKALGIPTLMGVGGVESFQFNENKDIILDSRENFSILLTEPTRDEYENYLKEYRKFIELNNEIEALRGKEIFSRDGQKILLKANLGGEIEISQLKIYQPDGVGLLRTEFLYMDSDEFPDEETQYKLYEKVYKELGEDKPLIIRTLDIGGDKTLSYFKLPEEENPFLGLRAIRLCLRNPEIFKVQLRALLRVSYNRNIKVMIPMISRIEEIRETKKIIEDIKLELDKDKIPYEKDLKMGIMIEVPSAAILADQLIEEVDF
jgi:phosphotransferase system enzyme I (PtsI)